MRFVCALIATSALSIAGPALAAADVCGLAPPASEALRPSVRGVTPKDLVALRDIGPAYLELPRERIFTLSPDGNRVAFQLRRAAVEHNTYCLGMFVLDRRDPSKLVEVDQGGDYLMAKSAAWGFADSPPPGIPLIITPAWSSDGKWIAYLRRDHGSTQVWRARTDGSGAEPVTHLSYDVDDFVWSPDNLDLIVRGRPALNRFEAEVAKEGEAGYHFDDRFIASIAAKPLPREPMDSVYATVSVSTGAVREATAVERSLIDPKTSGRELSSSRWSVSGAHGEMATLAPQDPENISSPIVLKVRNRSGTITACTHDRCRGVGDAWFDGAGGLVFLRRIRGHNEQEVFRLPPGQTMPTLVFRTDNLLSACSLSGDILVCAEETPTQPRRIVELNLRTQAVTTLFEPNPEFATLRLGTAQILHWTNSYGVESFGTLVLPPDHKTGDKHPLILVGYIARGFQRGGTGDEYPILALAEKGYAVLSYQTPPEVAYAKGAKTPADLGRLNRVDWIDYRNTAASIEAGVQSAIDLGVVDQTRLGLTGLSYGASVAQLTLVNSRHYGAAILSTCCEEESNATMLAGPGFAKAVHAMGYPGLTEAGVPFWSPISFRVNARTMTTPLLLQVADKEFLGTTEAVMSLREAGQPVDMYVYPNENHIKWQPEHRLAVYTRSIQWFDFWLRGIEDPDPLAADQYPYWRALRSATSNRLGEAPGH